MRFDLATDGPILDRTPTVLRALLQGLDQGWTHANYGDGTWSPVQIVAHYLHNDLTDWVPRLEWIIDHGEEPFAPYDPQGNVAFESLSLDALLDQFADARQASMSRLRSLLTPEVLRLHGTHPAFGRVSVEQLLAAWVVHDLHHIGQLAKAMAHQHRDEVGPWRAYLSVLG